jgi:hypothetical protein
MKQLLIAAGLSTLFCAACQQPAARLNAPPHGKTQRPSEMQSMYTYMLDNGMLEDMSVADVHFVPHRARLNSLGETRLTRLAELLQEYGGTIRFSTNETEAELVNARADSIREFLCAAGIDTTREVLERNLPGGRGMLATEAILIKANEATYHPKKKAGSTGGEAAMFDQSNGDR